MEWFQKYRDLFYGIGLEINATEQFGPRCVLT